MTKYLLCIDGSESSSKAFDHVIDMIRPTEDTVVMVTICEPLQDIGAERSVLEALKVQAQRDARLRLQQFDDICRDRKIHSVMQVLQGSPREKILEAAESQKPDLIVLGSRGLSGLRKLMLGSVSEYVLHNADCAVLVVPAAAA